jgi:hypothetical protein
MRILTHLNENAPSRVSTNRVVEIIDGWLHWSGDGGPGELYRPPRFAERYVGTAPGVGLVGSIRGSYDSIFAGASLAPRRRIFAIKPKGIPIHPDILVSIYHYESGIGRWKA